MFLPDPTAAGHAIIYPPYPLTISRVFQTVKVSSMISINFGRGEAGELWQGRFFDRALRTVKEYMETLEYIHLNPVRRGLVKRAEDWRWSSVHEYAGWRRAQLCVSASSAACSRCRRSLQMPFPARPLAVYH
jgi:hypothetical protein